MPSSGNAEIKRFLQALQRGSVLDATITGNEPVLVESKPIFLHFIKDRATLSRVTGFPLLSIVVLFEGAINNQRARCNSKNVLSDLQVVHFQLVTGFHREV